MFKTPLWTLELIRDTDAPFERVREVLLDGPRYGAWHPVYRSASPRIMNEADGLVEIDSEESPFPGVTERMHFQIRRQEGRSEEHTSELQSPVHLVCRLLLE